MRIRRVPRVLGVDSATTSTLDTLKNKEIHSILTMKKVTPLFRYTLLMMFLYITPLFPLHAQTAGADVAFTKYHLWDEFYTEGITIADVNKDGKTDIIAGARWFEAPSWKVHDIWKHKKFDYTKGYSDSFLNYATDVNEDGWVDLICFDFPGKEVYWL